MEVIEKTRWEGDKTDAFENERKDEERNEWNEEILKRDKFGKTRKDTRWKKRIVIVIDPLRMQRIKDGGMRKQKDM